MSSRELGERMANPLFSIVIPTYNRQDLVPYAIRSVLQQTFDDYEIIVCDNFSTDNTAATVSQFKDPRVKYIRTPQHFVIADNFEFSRKHASGQLVLMMSDDDAFVSTALETIYQEYRRHGAEFIFVKIAEYRDNGFPGMERNILDCPPFTGERRILHPDEFLNPLFRFKDLKFNAHPSGFVFARNIGESAAKRSGRFFQTNGVEFFALPVAAILTNKIVYIDLPLVILGRTKKSWGSNIRLCNPGKELIKKFIDDVEKIQKSSPLSNFTMCNLIAEGILTAKKLFPKEFEKYEFDEAQFIIMTIEELKDRKRQGVDVFREMDEINHYLNQNPPLRNEILQRERAFEIKKTRWEKFRSLLGDLGLRKIKEKVTAPRNLKQRTNIGAQKIQRGDVKSGFRISGEDFGFHDILGVSEFLTRITLRSN
jgi:glycosyltransferase involved in cell wall biosynthesis